MNIFKSKEIYKRIPQVDPALNPLRVVRGVWVSGEYRPPYCIDETVHVQAFGSNDAEIRVYTSRTQNIDDQDTIEYTGLYYPQMGFVIDQYSTSSLTLPDDTTVEYIGIYSEDFDILNYTQSTFNIPDDTTVEYLNIYTDGEFQLELYESIDKKLNPEPMIHIIGFGSDNELVVENN